MERREGETEGRATAERKKERKKKEEEKLRRRRRRRRVGSEWQGRANGGGPETGWVERWMDGWMALSSSTTATATATEFIHPSITTTDGRERTDETVLAALWW